MRMRNPWATALLAVFAAAGLASAQAPPPKPASEQEKPKPPAKKPKRVWTDEDMQGLRKPWDEHTAKKEAEEAAKAQQAKAGDKNPQEEPPAPEEIDAKTGKKLVDPDSLEGLEKQLSGWEQELKRTEGLAEQARKDMVNAPTREAWESAKTFLETYEANIVDMQQRIVDLRARIEAKKKEQGAPAPKPAEKPAAPAPSQL